MSIETNKALVARFVTEAEQDGNLALACSHCNLHKGPNLAGIDPVGKKIEPLYHPRTQPWNDHFEFYSGWFPCSCYLFSRLAKSGFRSNALGSTAQPF